MPNSRKSLTEPEVRILQIAHERRIARLETLPGSVIAIPAEYPDGYYVPFHHHSRAQLLYASNGVVIVVTHSGRWMIPAGYAMWIPAGIEHSVRIIGEVHMRSVYISPGAADNVRDYLHVVGLTDLMRSLIIDVTSNDDAPEPGSRKALVTDLILRDIGNLPEQPLGLPIPSDPRLDQLCREFLQAPSARATIDAWAARLAMSRRSFTRHFQKQTGISLSVWRQQACLFAAVPRLASGETITAVALDLGYDSVSAFTTMFRRMLGVSPRFYHKNEQTAH